MTTKTVSPKAIHADYEKYSGALWGYLKNFTVDEAMAAKILIETFREWILTPEIPGFSRKYTQLVRIATAKAVENLKLSPDRLQVIILSYALYIRANKP